MGPVAFIDSSGLPDRLRGSWDVETVPRTDGTGNLQEFLDSVNNLSEFHDELSDANANNIPKNLCGTVLLSHLYVRAQDLSMGLTKDLIKSSNDVQAIFDVLYQRDPLSVVAELQKDLIDLLFTTTNTNESFINFEARFAAQLKKFNAHGSAVKDTISGLVLLSDTSLEGSQGISLLSAPAPNLDDELTSSSKTFDYIEKLLLYA